MDPSVHLHDTEGFLFKVGVNLLRDRARRERARFAVFEPARADFIAVATEPDAERVLQAKAEIREVMIWLNSLSERTRNIFVLRRFEQMKCEQIAGLYGISINAVEQHIRKALASLAKSRMKSHD
jgi:RNA polymerase sigma factor (sigma-70 family)